MTNSACSAPRRTLSSFAALLAVCFFASSAFASDLNVANGKVSKLQSLPQAVASAQSHLLGALDSARHLKLAINLPVRNQAALDALVQQLYDPRSPNYHKYLSVEQFTEQFGPSQADYDTVVAWANAQGLKVTNTPRNRHLLDVEGSVETINRALHVSMSLYQHPTAQRQFFAPDREPTVNLSLPLLQITGLDNYTLPTTHLKKGDFAKALQPTTKAGSGPNGMYLPSDMRAAYYGSGSLTGAGQTVGIFSYDGYLASDVQLFYSTTGMTSNVPINNVLVNGYSGTCTDPAGGTTECSDGEQVLDIVNVIGMAPGLTQVLFYEGDSGLDVLNQMATDNIAKVLSSSWGSGELGQGADPIFQEFQAQGQTFANATGDSGSYGSSSWSPPSLNPHLLQVGGTDLTTTNAGGAWMTETAWSDAGGGFYSPSGYSIPAYQQAAGVINGSNNGSTTLRNDPDVAAEANFDNPTVSNGSYEERYGGTSFAAPRWAGFIALVNEQSIANGGAPVGFVNPALYAIGTGADYATNFHDVVSGSNGAFNAVAGYDLVTGWGSPAGENLIGALAGSTSTPGFVLATYPLSLSTVQNSSVSTDITVNPINGFTDAVDLTATGLPNGVTATFSPSSTSDVSTVTFTADASATIGTRVITISGGSGVLAQTTSVSLLVGNVPSAGVGPGLSFDAVVPLGKQTESLTVSNAVDSVALTYSLAAFASTDGSCTGSVSWLAIPVTDGSLAGGGNANLDVSVTPGAATLTPGDYAAEICIATNDPAHTQIVVPVSLTVIPGPQHETIFLGGFESGEVSGTAAHIVTFVIDQAAEATQAGSALDLATGNYHTWNPIDIDNINPYLDEGGGSGMNVYWYNDLLPTAVKNRVGGVTVSGKYAVLHPGATVGPSSTFSRTIATMPNWIVGADGYIGIAFYNSQTHALNYGYIHMTTTAPTGFPARVLEYGFDSSGAAIRIP